MKKNNRKPNRPENKIRIISGRWRRRSLTVANADGLRPSGDRIRETLFNWLMPHVAGARALDLFAGTGALGLEALSRDASFVHFIEMNKAVADRLSANLVSLNAQRDTYSLESCDALTWLTSYRGEPFELVFLDPPFAKDHWDNCFHLLNSAKLLSPEALIYVEKPAETKLNTPQNWQSYRSLRAGKIEVQLFEFKALIEER